MNKDGKFVDVGFNGEGHNIISYKIPKIYRTGYSSNKGGIGYLDPTLERRYGRIPMPISDIALSGSDSDMKGDVLFLCIFNNKDWIPVAVSATENKKTMTFGNVARGIPFGDNKIAGYQNEGKGIVYLPASVRNGVMVPFATPFILKENGDVHKLTPDHSALRSISLYRKYPKYGISQFMPQEWQTDVLKYPTRPTSRLPKESIQSKNLPSTPWQKSTYTLLPPAVISDIRHRTNLG
mgnify:CR=1 FL=1